VGGATYFCALGLVASWGISGTVGWEKTLDKS